MPSDAIRATGFTIRQALKDARAAAMTALQFEFEYATISRSRSREDHVAELRLL